MYISIYITKPLGSFLKKGRTPGVLTDFPYSKKASISLLPPIEEQELYFLELC